MTEHGLPAAVSAVAALAVGCSPAGVAGAVSTELTWGAGAPTRTEPYLSSRRQVART